MGITTLITNVHYKDYQVYNYALSKHKMEEEMMKTCYYETFEIKDDQNATLELMLMI